MTSVHLVMERSVIIAEYDVHIFRSSMNLPLQGVHQPRESPAFPIARSLCSGPPGLLGSRDEEFQSTSFCAGLCPAGKLCDAPATVEPLPCPAGHACPPPGRKTR